MIVEYNLKVETANYIRYKSYFELRVPKEIAIVDSRILKCEEQATGRTISCRMQNSDDPQY